MRFIGIAISGWIFLTTTVSHAKVSDLEMQRAIERNIEFYRGEKKAMWREPDRLDLESGKLESGYHALQSRHSDPGFEWKRSETYSRYLCESYPHSALHPYRCGDFNAEVEDDDRVDALLKSWIAEGDVLHGLESLSVAGESALHPWSGDYWKFKYGGIAYRYKNHPKFASYAEAMSAYQQPQEWNALKGAPLPALKLGQIVSDWSPAEKYDLTVGDFEFALTQAQKSHGAEMIQQLGEIPFWSGMCDGWSAASSMVAQPTRTVNVKMVGDASLKWYPGDVEALLTLAWANGDLPANGMGGRCRAEGKPQTFGNGRIIQQECFDTNPASFHLALANLIGGAGMPLIMDSAYDSEVWNYPIFRYEFRYFNPEDPEHLSTDWRNMWVPYDAIFRAQDRFQSPLTRGKRISGGRDDSGIDAIVGVVAYVTYPALRPPFHQTEPTQSIFKRTAYHYDLELHKSFSGWEIVGGEWHSNVHPDFLWVVKNQAAPSISEEQFPFDFDLSRMPSPWMSKLAHRASQSNKVLCKITESILENSKEATDPRSFHCW